MLDVHWLSSPSTGTSFRPAHLERVKQIMQDACAGLEPNSWSQREPGHEHPLVHFPPTVAISCLVNNLKGVSSRRLRIESPNGGYYWQANRLWSGRPAPEGPAARASPCRASTSN